MQISTTDNDNKQSLFFQSKYMPSVIQINVFQPSIMTYLHQNYHSHTNSRTSNCKKIDFEKRERNICIQKSNVIIIRNSSEGKTDFKAPAIHSKFCYFCS